ncbi:16S rRNA (guanine(527)-N(7))-methyltransferase RsmG [Alteromonas gilva]|uniref:Ribosomal RNA small subunit methyltransferase G n=1 Tax=Alteromonas gilva TaxID=2987522 RepID=A0ABT5KWN4_9ALTE|nr:16S rRNA (guanine(527)-N(7))-methyltransferase RsmG [Alteromonas gilva]MDC8829170.1 16S rRNA (guanine(527)-N(7))-methyltransferase RsmG [Alteromonas gilva]
MSFEREKLSLMLRDGAAAMSLPLSGQQHNLLLDYVERIHKWNKAFNLTSVRDPEQMMVKHILDSLAVVPFLDQQHYIDVGTGPGLPGIPLAIACPEKSFTLLDSLGKRVRFMKQCAFEMKLININPIQSRVEEHQPEQYYDAVLSRAFASLKDMLHWCQHLVDSKGKFLALKGQYPADEIAAIPDAFTLESSVELYVPGLQGERHLLTVQKS